MLIEELIKHARADPHSKVNLPILENLVITWPYTARATDRPPTPQAHQYKIILLSGMATQMQRKKIAWPPGLLERKKNNNNKVVSFLVLFLMFTLKWITQKELGRRIYLHENFIAVVRKWEMLEARRTWTQETKSLVSTYDNSSLKITILKLNIVKRHYPHRLTVHFL